MIEKCKRSDFTKNSKDDSSSLKKLEIGLAMQYCFLEYLNRMPTQEEIDKIRYLCSVYSIYRVSMIFHLLVLDDDFREVSLKRFICNPMMFLFAQSMEMDNWYHSDYIFRYYFQDVLGEDEGIWGESKTIKPFKL